MKHNDQESQDGSSLFLLQKAKVDKLMRNSKFPSFSPVLRAMAMVTVKVEEKEKEKEKVKEKGGRMKAAR